MTYAEIEAKVRLLVNDTAEPHRFASEDIWDFAATAVRHLRNVCPSERYGADGMLDEPVPAPAANTDVRFSEKYAEAIVKYTAHKVYELDMSDTVNMQLSEMLRTRAETLMQL